MKGLPKIIISCKDAGQYIQKKEEGALGSWANFQLKIHLLYCKLCRAYEKQSAKLNELLENHFEPNKSSQNKDFKEKLKAEIQKKSEA